MRRSLTAQTDGEPVSRSSPSERGWWNARHGRSSIYSSRSNARTQASSSETSRPTNQFDATRLKPSTRYTILPSIYDHATTHRMGFRISFATLISNPMPPLELRRETTNRVTSSQRSHVAAAHAPKASRIPLTRTYHRALGACSTSATPYPAKALNSPRRFRM